MWLERPRLLCVALDVAPLGARARSALPSVLLARVAEVSSLLRLDQRWRLKAASVLLAGERDFDVRLQQPRLSCAPVNAGPARRVGRLSRLDGSSLDATSNLPIRKPQPGSRERDMRQGSGKGGGDTAGSF